jgi:hypothetical protein
MYNQRSRRIFVMILVFIFAFLDFTLGVAAIGLSRENEFDCCQHKIRDISIDYKTWLLVFGVSGVINATLTPLQFCVSKSNRLLIVWLYWGVCCVTRLFVFLWFMLGIMVYFATVYPYCQSVEPRVSFGQSIIVIKTIIFACALFTFPQKQESREAIELVNRNERI